MLPLPHALPRYKGPYTAVPFTQHIICLTIKKKSQSVLKDKKALHKETEQASELAGIQNYQTSILKQP